ncbi:MAG: hypothetical protein GX458_09440 [Phyllobacteriaceae bacterium]|nr:hypothetical protein [Phyllobacteriaceae bacterium]
MVRGDFIRRLLTRPVRRLLCTTAGAYPLITTIIAVIGPLTVDWPLPARTAAIVPFMVGGMAFLVAPAVDRWGGRWIAAGAVGAETA